MNEFEQMALDEASLSKCAKRKVGAVIVDANGMVIGRGHNHRPNNGPCEVGNATYADVIHAEVAAIESLSKSVLKVAHPLHMYCTHTPCEPCAKAIRKANIVEVCVVEQFMKFDTDKLRYDLIPPSAMEGLAEVLTYGAKKYKPNNWKNGDLDRYVAALYRHLEAWRKGEKKDEESGMKHLAHAITNVAFLLELDNEE